MIDKINRNQEQSTLATNTKQHNGEHAHNHVKQNKISDTTQEKTIKTTNNKHKQQHSNTITNKHTNVFS
jgi:hypothetical protein